MKIDDLITEAPMGLLKKLWTKGKTFVPGVTGARAQGEYDVGRVANQWHKEYMNFIGQLGRDDYGSHKTFSAFLSHLGFTPLEIKKVLKGGGVKEAQEIYEANLTPKVLDALMTRAARVAAMGRYGKQGSKQELPPEPNPTAPRKPGAIDKAVDIGKQVVPQVGKAAQAVGSQIGKKAADYRAARDARRAGTTVPQRIEPTVDIPTAQPQPPAPKPAPYVPSHRPVKKPRPVTKYK